MSFRTQGRYLLKTLVYWLALFNLGRFIFMIYFHENYRHQSVGQLLGVFPHALRLDLSTAGYALLLPIAVSTVALVVGQRMLRVFDAVYEIALTLFFAIAVVSDLGIYAAWGSKLNARAVGFIVYPEEAAASVETRLFVEFGLLAVFVLLFAWLLHRRLFRFRDSSAKPFGAQWALMPVLFVGYLFVDVLMIRGGLQEIPINESAAYYSTNQRLNHAAVNTTWYVLHSLYENRENDNRKLFALLPDAQAERRVDSLTQTHALNQSDLFSVPRPNIVFIQLESFTADVIGALGGEKNVAPTIDSLIKRGLLFTNIYAPGFRTDQGLVSILCAFPAQPTASVIKQSDKLERMPNLTQHLKQAGYSSSFYYGGELGFGNIRSFVLVNGFDKYSSINDYPKTQLETKWGAHDQYVLAKQASELGQLRQPFFSYLMTLSSHEPFDVPGPVRFNEHNEPARFKNACAYTDRCLGDYFKRVQSAPWYNNTLFVLCADHGHVLPRNREYNEPARYHIPLIFFGPALNKKYVGQRIGTVGSQVDIAATILSAIHQPDSAFRWSTNLLDTARRQFAYYSFDDGVGMVTQNASVGYDFRNNRTVFLKGTADSGALVADVKAYLQILMRDYENY